MSDTSASVPVPIRSLVGVERIMLEAGEKRRIKFTITPRQMSLILDSGQRAIEPGNFTVSVGGEQPDFSGSSDAKTTDFIKGNFTVTGKIFILADK